MKKIRENIYSVDSWLDEMLGAEGTPEREENNRKAEAFFTGQIIEDARKAANVTQAELASRIGTNKSYISRVETGRTEPRVSTFYRIADALGMTIQMTFKNNRVPELV